MSKVRVCLVLAGALVFYLAFAAPAFAWTHGQFTASTDACAGCHVAHAAQAPKLLKTGPTQTQFCFMCHGDGTVSAPYDVKDGFTSNDRGTAKYASTAGGFEQQWNGTGFSAVTSRHNVWGYSTESGPVDENDGLDVFIPGGTGTITGSGFVCSSCHDPHAGGAIPDGNGVIDGSAGPNPRLLRKTITVSDNTYSNLYMKFKVDTTLSDFVYSGVASGVYRVVEYLCDYGTIDPDGTAYGSSKWCGACHNIFKVRYWTSGNLDFFGTMKRHPVFGHAVLPAGADGTMETGTPLETDTYPISTAISKYVGCLTCHRAHSSTATVAGWASSWPRDSGGTSNTSALLRMNNRGICFNCHDAAKFNCSKDTRVISGSDQKCTSCHQ